MIVVDTIVRDNGGSGIVLNADASAVLDHVRSEHNGVQGFAAAPATSDATATVSDSVFVHNVANGIIVTSGPSTTARVHVERSVMSNNGGAGFFEFASASGGSAWAMLTRNAIAHNSGDGIAMSGDSLGVSNGFVADNAIYNNNLGIHVLGRAGVTASANTVNLNHLADIDCDVAHSIFSTGNNNLSFDLVGNCWTVLRGW